MAGWGARSTPILWWQSLRPEIVTLGEHQCEILTAHLEPGFLPGGGYTDLQTVCHGPGSMIYQANCEPCRWHIIADTENAVVEGWHDHAVPGWRDLPVIPTHIGEQASMGTWPKKALAWIAAHYPKDWQATGYPCISERPREWATRHVPGYSPFGGYELAHTAVPEERRPQRPAEQLSLF